MQNSYSLSKNKIKDIILNYYKTYRNNIKSLVEDLDNSPQIIPEMFLGSKLTKAFLSADGYILVFTYPSDQEKFYFLKSNFDHKQIITKNSVYGDYNLTMGFDLDVDDNTRNIINISKAAIKDELSGKIYYSNWDTLDIIGIYRVGEFTSQKALFDSDKNLNAFYLNKTLNINLDESEVYKNSTAIFYKLKEIVLEFKNLLDSRLNANESVFHNYLYKYPELIYRDFFEKCLSKEKFYYPAGTSGVNNKIYVEPDLIFILKRQQYILVELEKPSKQISTSGGQQMATLTQSAFQIEEWSSYIQEFGGTCLKDRFPGIHSPHSRKFIIIISRDTINGYAGKSKEEYMRIIKSNLQLNVDYLTYDDIVNDTLDFCNKYGS